MVTQVEVKEAPKGPQWTLVKEIVGTFLGALPLVLVVAGFIMNLYSDVNVLKAQVAAQERRDAAQDAVMRDGLTRIEAQLAEIQRYLRDHRT